MAAIIFPRARAIARLKDIIVRLWEMIETSFGANSNSKAVEVNAIMRAYTIGSFLLEGSWMTVNFALAHLSYTSCCLPTIEELLGVHLIENHILASFLYISIHFLIVLSCTLYNLEVPLYPSSATCCSNTSFNPEGSITV